MAKLIELAISFQQKLLDPALWTKKPDDTQLSLSTKIDYLLYCRDKTACKFVVLFHERMIYQLLCLIPDQDRAQSLLGLYLNQILLPSLKGHLKYDCGTVLFL